MGTLLKVFSPEKRAPIFVEAPSLWVRCSRLFFPRKNGPHIFGNPWLVGRLLKAIFSERKSRLFETLRESSQEVQRVGAHHGGSISAESQHPALNKINYGLESIANSVGIFLYTSLIISERTDAIFQMTPTNNQILKAYWFQGWGKNSNTSILTNQPLS